eukprot:CAMPEP_0198708144 /NCGR_PEP_ID=MMETSP1471-20131121/881_1 /TAXON_ID=41880 /ORGANISM="Pycnococcus provasolii, Strain RCC733" /LENGTH=136 /DNA_ID=CAMNT_0044467337 /DNA_START=46 /DNA_END=457 /DNA_ORIENTATION=+
MAEFVWRIAHRGEAHVYSRRIHNLPTRMMVTGAIIVALEFHMYESVKVKVRPAPRDNRDDMFAVHPRAVATAPIMVCLQLTATTAPASRSPRIALANVCSSPRAKDVLMEMLRAIASGINVSYSRAMKGGLPGFIA